MDKIIESFVKNKKGIFIMMFAALMTAIGQLFWKLSSSENIYFLGLGFIFYGIGAILMIIAFKFGKYSVIHPMMCTGYIFAIILGTLVLKEKISMNQMLGISSMIFGVILIGGGDY